MLQSGHPLREKMTLFWHNHFATSIAKVQSTTLMFRQNCLLRDHALSRLGPLLHAITRDPAMLLWLDSNSNVRGKPNENYARELMELFSLGVGHYTEKDIREAARSFTGWRTDGESVRFDPRFHDDGMKTVLGKTGCWNAEDGVRIVLEQPAVAPFLVRKLYQFLVSERPVPDSLLKPLCESFRDSDYDVAGVVRTILASRHFYSDCAFRQRIKGPVEYVLGAVKAVCCYGNTENASPLPQRVLVGWLGAMGQDLFAPPNVKGWPGGTAWLNTSTMLERDNFAAALATGTLWASVNTDSLLRQTYDPARILIEENVISAENIVHGLLELYLPGGVRAEVRQKLVEFVADGKLVGAALCRRVCEAVHALLSVPEYQLA
jgi:uncharacterized protein (DUF1800 family)